jgi:hypothetical protein
MPFAFEQITDPETRVLAGLAESLREDYENEEVDPWAKSPFGWIKKRPSRQVGAIGEKLVAGWCATKDFDVIRSTNSDADRIIEGHRIEIKFSTLWANGGYKFQQVRDQQYDYLFGIGVSPFESHAWIVPKHVLHEHVIGVTGQHTGSAGTDTAWIGFKASDPPDWIRPYGGTLSEARDVLLGYGRGPYAG